MIVLTTYHDRLCLRRLSEPRHRTLFTVLHNITNDFPDIGGGETSSLANTSASSTTDVSVESCSKGNEAPVAASSDDDDGDGDGEDDWRRTDSPKNSPSNGHEPHQRGIARTIGTRKAAAKQPQPLDSMLWRLPTVLNHVPVSRSTWFAGVKSGRYPKPIKLGSRAVAWRADDIRSLVNSFEAK